MTAATVIAAPSGLDKLVREACAVVRELGQPEPKLEALAFSREAGELAKASLKRLRELDEQIHRRVLSMQVDDVIQTIRVMERLAMDPHLKSPPRDPRRLNHCLAQRTREQAVAINVNLWELFAIASMRAAERHPERFGTAKSSKAVRMRRAALEAKRDELFAQIAASYSPADIQRISGGNVAPAPSGTLPARLVAWAMSSGF